MTRPVGDSREVRDVAARLRAAGCVFAEDEAAVLLSSARDADHLRDMVERRAQGRPLEHVVGWAELAGVRVRVDDGVFVPRRRSELLVREAVAAAVAVTGRPVVVDLCCGSGAVGVAVAAGVAARLTSVAARLTSASGVELHAADVDPRAVTCARANVEPLGGEAHEGDLYAALPDRLHGRVDVLVVNAPYVPTGEIALLPPEARDHEPLLALDGGRDGVDVHRRVAQGAPDWLAPAGAVLVETSRRQAPTTLAALEGAGLEGHLVTDDDLDATVVVATPRSS